MSVPHLRWSLAMLWSSVALLIFVSAGTASPRGWVYLAVLGLIPPATFIALWSEGPPPTVAEVLHTTEGRR